MDPMDLAHLPPAPDLAAWERLGRLPRDSPAYEGAALRVARRHGHDARSAVRFPRGSLPVLEVGGETVVKLFPPVYAGEAGREARVLRFLRGRLPVAVPALLGEGTVDGWSYLLMGRVPGRPLRDEWPSLDGGERGALVEAIGRTVAALHAIGGALPELDPPWERFLAERVACCAAHHRGRRLEPEWVEQLAPFVESAGAGRDRGRRALLHTEVMLDHVLVERDRSSLRLSGLVDFEPAMVGDPEYELASVAVFVVWGELPLWERFFAGYGEPEPGWRSRVMGHLVLHRYSDLGWYRRLLPSAGATTLEDLERLWLGAP